MFSRAPYLTADEVDHIIQVAGRSFDSENRWRAILAFDLFRDFAAQGMRREVLYTYHDVSWAFGIVLWYRLMDDLATWVQDNPPAADTVLDILLGRSGDLRMPAAAQDRAVKLAPGYDPVWLIPEFVITTQELDLPALPSMRELVTPADMQRWTVRLQGKRGAVLERLCAYLRWLDLPGAPQLPG